MNYKDVKGRVIIKGKYIRKHEPLPIEKKDIGISIEELEDYFSDIKYRGIYFVTLKQEVANKLREAGYSFMQIGDIMDLHYSNVIHLVNTRKEDAQCFEVKYNWKDIIQEKKYPITVNNSKWHRENMNYDKYISVLYVDKSELLSYIC